MLQGNTFGLAFRVTTFGESHGPGLGLIIDGCPAGLKVDMELIETELKRRRTGQSKLVSQRQEEDKFEFLSGIFNGQTTGCPIAVIIRNTDSRSKDYDTIKDLFRPGHADFGYFAKYGIRDYRGGGRSSARETTSRVIAGAIAKQLLGTIGVSIRAGLLQLGTVKAEQYCWEQVELNELRALDPAKLEPMREELEQARKQRDSLGAIVEAQALNVPTGLGEPVFSKLDAMLAAAMLSIPAVKGIEFGSGFALAAARGSAVNDALSPEGFLSNHHGGILGGISSGAPIVLRLAFKPTSSIPQEQQTIDVNFEPREISTKGRHDPCVALRAPVIVEAMFALTLVDAWLQDAAAESLRSHFAPRARVKYQLKP